MYKTQKNMKKHFIFTKKCGIISLVVFEKWQLPQRFCGRAAL